MADSKADSDYIEEARERYTESSDAWSEVRDASLEDRKFSRLSTMRGRISLLSMSGPLITLLTHVPLRL